MSQIRTITVLTPCFNEAENVAALYERVRAVFESLGDAYRYEHLFIDNASTDGTAEILRGLASRDRNVKVIVNTRNFGHIRSPYYGLLQAKGDAAIMLVSDLQDPPAMIKDFIRKWEEGYKVVMGVKTKSRESALMFFIRKMYYGLINKLSEIELIKNATGFGLYDRQVIDILKEINDPYPYVRGLITEIGFEIAKIEYTQEKRERGVTKNNFYTLYDLAMLGITNHSKVPLRIATMLGFALSGISLLVAIGYFIAKLLFWNTFTMGIAPIVISLFFFASVQLFFIGIIGEYIGSIHTQVLKRPLVIEKERINFD